MKIADLKHALANHPEANIRFRLPDGLLVAAHAHVTEAARVDKNFVDCGGTFRKESVCRLQTWVHDDLGHRLKAGKLLRILEKAGKVLLTDELEVDVEHELTYISQFPVVAVDALGDEIVFELSTRHAACLAMELCCPPPKESVSDFRPLTFQVNHE
jgi:hypothetical protein